jgi:hypothetical protein
LKTGRVLRKSSGTIGPLQKKVDVLISRSSFLMPFLDMLQMFLG